MVEVLEKSREFDQEQFDEFCKKTGLHYPPELVAFLKEYNDGELAPNMVKPAGDDCVIRCFYGTSELDCYHIPWVYDCYRDRLHENCIPIAEVHGGNLVCMYMDPADERYVICYYWDHETMDSDIDEPCRIQREDMVFLAEDFSQLLENIVDYPQEEWEQAIPVESKPSFGGRIAAFFKNLWR